MNFGENFGGRNSDFSKQNEMIQKHPEGQMPGEEMSARPWANIHTGHIKNSKNNYYTWAT